MNIKFILFIALCMAFYCCESFIEVPSPKHLLDAQTVFENEDTANSALTNIYTTLNANPGLSYQISLLTGLYADELDSYATAPTIQQVYRNELVATDSYTSNLWTNLYNVIYQANAVWEGCNRSNSISQELKKQLMAEALFCRAFSYFYLVNLFENIPIITSTEYSTNATTKQSASDEVYEQIIADLLQAKQDLKPNYIGADGLSDISDRVRVNKYTATALLARVYLYKQQWEKAEIEANEVITQTHLYDIVDLDEVFLVNSEETIWQLQMPTPTSNRNTYEGSFFTLTARPNVGITNSSTISNFLLQRFEQGDLRSNSWIGTYLDLSGSPNLEYIFPSKYKVQNSASISERTAVFRLGELYLIRAESRAQQGKLSESIQDLDLIRRRSNRKGIQEINPLINQNELIRQIIEERQLELCFEWGHRWLDLKRSGLVDDVLNEVVLLKGGTWVSYKQLWPIPFIELERAPQLIQNIGY